MSGDRLVMQRRDSGARWLMEDLRGRLGQCPVNGSVKTRDRR